MAKKKVAKLQYKEPETQDTDEIKFFSGLVSMQKVHPLIMSTAQKFDYKQLLKFKKQLLKHSSLHKLPKQLDTYLDSLIDEKKQEQTNETHNYKDQF